MSTFELIPEDPNPTPGHTLAGQFGLGKSVLAANARWFTWVRWIVVVLLVLTGALGSFTPGLFERHGFAAPGRWPWGLALILGLANAVFAIVAERLNQDSSRTALVSQIWVQIGLDLFVLTAAVYYIGSTVTLISVAYVLHIVLACIFFPRKHSLLVTLLATVLFMGCVALEVGGVLPDRSILAQAAPRSALSGLFRLFSAGFAALVWLVVWHFSSTLSESVQRRGQELRKANENLIRADREKNREVLRTTHDLKAPFSGIHSNIEVLKLLYWDDVPPHVREIIKRIEDRTLALHETIRDTLALGNAVSRERHENELEAVDLQSVIHDVISDLRERIKERQVELDLALPPLVVESDRKQLFTLFSNLVANAIFYSHESGRVEITGVADRDGATLTVADHGIGIKAEALPHIFEEHFRTREAVRFNKLSTGLGLAIVRHVATNLDIKIKVTSAVEQGTSFEVRIPKQVKQTGD